MGDGAPVPNPAEDVDTEIGGVDSKVKTFRERRLSMSQMHDPNSKQRRRLSIYGGSGDDEDKIPSVVESPVPSCGCKTVGGVEPVPGGSTAKINQDRGIAIFPFNSDVTTGLFGVYDGHGRVGEQVSEYVIQSLPHALLSNPLLASQPDKALMECYLTVDETLADNVDSTVSGTTAVTCLMKNNHLTIANSGDSRAVVARRMPNSSALKAIDLTIDQKPDTPQEMKRILQMGGHVTPVREE